MGITATIEFQCDFCGVIARQAYTDAARYRMEAAGWHFVKNGTHSDHAFCPQHDRVSHLDFARRHAAGE